MIPPRDPKAPPARRRPAPDVPEPIFENEVTKPTASNLEDAIEHELARRESTPGPADEEEEEQKK